jgi:hypothetical protein
MRAATIMSAVLLGFGAVTAVAQPSVHPPDTATGARPGHEPGVGVSMPLSNKASNITPVDTRSTIAPTLPASSIGTNATAQDYLRAARASLIAGQTGATQQSLEMAETRALDRSVPTGQTSVPDPASLVASIRDARRAMGAGDNPRAIRIIDMALSS